MSSPDVEEAQVRYAAVTAIDAVGAPVTAPEAMEARRRARGAGRPSRMLAAVIGAMRALEAGGIPATRLVFWFHD